jgi:hypothetical protein
MFLLVALAPLISLPARALTYTFENANFAFPQGQISGSFDYTPGTGVTNFSSVNVSNWQEGTQAQAARYGSTTQLLEFSRRGSNQGDRQFFRISGLPLTGAPISLFSLQAELVVCNRSNCEGRPPRTQSFDVRFTPRNAELTTVPAGASAAALLPLGLLLGRGRRRYAASGTNRQVSWPAGKP